MITTIKTKSNYFIILFVLVSLPIISQTYTIQYKHFSESTDGNLVDLVEKWSNQKVEKTVAPDRILLYNNGISWFGSNKKSIITEDKENSDENTISVNRIVVGSVYKNQTKDLQMTDFGDIFKNRVDKNPILSTKLKKHDWQLHKTTQEIAGYNCKMATTVDSKGQKVIAWYTSDIPINEGPDYFWGLPGLIIQLQEGNTSLYIATSIQQEKKEIIIKKPEGNVMEKDIFDAFIKEMSKPTTYTRPDGTVVTTSGSRN